MYRNIDEDVKLLKFAKRYHSEDSLTIDQLKYIAKQDGYSEKEIELAINDYYWIYLSSPPENPIPLGAGMNGG
jgi:hypothetical protein